jgi:aminopeptidase N
MTTARPAYPDKPWQIWTHGEDRHFWFPCYDSPNDGATPEMFITVKRSYVAVSNAALNRLPSVDSSKAIAVAL